MTIYSNKQIIERMDELTHEQLIAKVIRILASQDMSERMRQRIANIMMSDAIQEELNPKVPIDSHRLVPADKLFTLAHSPMMEYAREIIQAALDPRGPHATREIMLIAATLKGGKAFYIKADGIKQEWKNQVGYILSMAGFERRSVYNKERQMPLKAWKSRAGWTIFDVDQRLAEVETTLGIYASNPKQLPSLIGKYL